MGGCSSRQQNVTVRRARPSTAVFPAAAPPTMESFLRRLVPTVTVNGEKSSAQMIAQVAFDLQIDSDSPNTLLEELRSRVGKTTMDAEQDLAKVIWELKYAKLVILAVESLKPRCSRPGCENAAEVESSCEHKDIYCCQCLSNRNLVCSSDRACRWSRSCTIIYYGWDSNHKYSFHAF